MIFNENFEVDIVNIYDYINAYAKELGHEKVLISDDFKSAYKDLRDQPLAFPCKDGVQASSVFKKAAAFIICFIENPVIKDLTQFNSKLPQELKEKNPNAILALDIALNFIVGSTIHRNSGGNRVVSNTIQLSKHSYIDFLDMLTKTKLKLCDDDGHFMLLSLLLEQLTYKTNGHLQYDETMKFGGAGLDIPILPQIYKPVVGAKEADWDDRDDVNNIQYDQPGFNSNKSNGNY